MGRVSSFVPERLKKRLSGLSGHFSHDSQPEHDSASVQGGDETALPALPSSFPSVLYWNKGTATRDLVRPYLEYETALRKGFAAGSSEIKKDANLVPVYSGHEKLFTVRDVDRKKDDSKKYLLPLEDSERESDGSLAVAPSLDEYMKDFDAFTHGVLTGIDWTNVVAAGSSALLPLLPKRKEALRHMNPAVENPRETYFENTASSSDIDLFIYGLESEDAARQRIIDLEAVIRKNQRLTPGTGLTLRSENAITFISPKFPHRHVQIILRLYKSISEVLTGFDVDCSCVAFDGSQVYTTPRGVAAITTRTNNIDLTRRSPSYENRLYKYRQHNFDVYWDCLERERIRDTVFDEATNVGLAKLLYFEEWMREGKRRRYLPRGHRYRTHRYTRRIDDSGDPGLLHASGYARHELLFGARCTAVKVREHILKNPEREPCMFGTIEEVTMNGESHGSGKLSGKATFIKDHPGRQMIGSFNPLTADDWTKTAYK